MTGAVAPSTESFAPALLAWAARSGRRDLPWQHDPMPYRVWVSEVMLQQTQVATVRPYFERFMSRFPDIETLAAATLDEVLNAWTGLGYYARARNLHAAARLVVEQHAGRLPDDIDELQRLPGIGRSTAGAILALACSQRQPILDANARRVLTRYFGIEGDPSTLPVRRRLWEMAEASTPHERVSEYTQAIMDLGAGVCEPTRPRCNECPLSRACRAFRAGRQDALPSAHRRAARPAHKSCAVVVVRPDGALLLERRPERGLWGGLWSFPMFEDRDEALRWLRGAFPGACVGAGPAPQSHTFTHFSLALELVVAHTAGPRRLPRGRLWYRPDRPARVGVTKAVSRFKFVTSSNALPAVHDLDVVAGADSSERQQ